MTEPVSCPPRTRNAAATRKAILDAAADRFLHESYENVGVRDIAGRAGVDVALVNRYFGSKKQLFVEVLRDCGDDFPPADIAAADLPAHFAGLVLQQGLDEVHRDVERLLIILRSASSPEAAEIVRQNLHTDVLSPLAALLDGADAEARASLSMAVWIGTTILRTIMTVEPLAGGPCDAIHARLVRLFAAALAVD